MSLLVGHPNLMAFPTNTTLRVLCACACVRVCVCVCVCVCVHVCVWCVCVCMLCVLCCVVLCVCVCVLCLCVCVRACRVRCAPPWGAENTMRAVYAIARHCSSHQAHSLVYPER